MMEHGRDLFMKCLKGEPLPRFAFIPLIGDVVARAGGMSYRDMCADPTLWANSLMKTADLFDLDGVVAGFDFSLMAEACGCAVCWEDDEPRIDGMPGAVSGAPESAGRMKHVIEATARLFQVCRPRRAAIAAMTGPVTLAAQLFGRGESVSRLGEVKQLVTRVAEAFCRLNPDLLIFMEDEALTRTEPGNAHIRAYNTLKNVTTYYNVTSALYLQDYQPADLPLFSALKMNIYIPGHSADASLPYRSQLEALNANARALACSLPLDDTGRAREVMEESVAFCRTQGKTGFFTSLGPVRRDAHLETIHRVVKEIQEMRL